MVTEFCRVERDGPVVLVTLDRPERMNALHREANHELGAVFDEFERDPSCRVAVVTGAGDRAFCAGADLKAVPGTDRHNATPPSGFGGITSRFDRTKPVIAAVNGVAVGGGFEIALACDVVVASDRATFGLTEPLVGLAALAGGIQRLIQAIGITRAAGLYLSARQVRAAEGLHLGFVNEVVAHDDLLPAARRWADDMLRCAPSSLRASLDIARSLDGRTLDASIAGMYDLPGVVALFESPNRIEGPTAFAERRPPIWSPS